jgi:hypothetical protein
LVSHSRRQTGLAASRRVERRSECRSSGLRLNVMPPTSIEGGSNNLAKSHPLKGNSERCRSYHGH